LILPTAVWAQKAGAKDAKKEDSKDRKEAVNAEEPAQKSFTCSSNIYYAWRRLPAEEPTADPKKGKKKPDKPVQLPAPDEAYHSRVRFSAPTPEAAQAGLREKLAEAQSQARRDCESQHQDLSGCLAYGLRTARTEYEVFDYELRRSFIEALSADCKLNAGVCVSTRTDEPKCLEDPHLDSANDGSADGMGKKDADAAKATDGKPKEKKDSKK
jgi:hypothetical protein